MQIPLQYKIHFQTEQRERFEKDNETTLTEEADRIKMESEQEKTDIQVWSIYIYMQVLNF